MSDLLPAPAARLVVLFEGRTGSSHLYSMLKEHPGIAFYPEEPARLARLGWGTQRAWIEDCLRGALVADATKRAAPGLAVGFKTKLRDVLAPRAFAELLTRHAVTVVRMHRRNRVKQAVSWIRAEALAAECGLYNVDRRTVALARPPFAIAAEVLAARLARQQEWEERLDAFVHALPLPVHWLAYEDLVAHRDRVLERVCELLGQPPFVPFVYHRKHTDDDLRAALPNWDELRAAFHGTPYGEQLVADPPPSAAEQPRLGAP
jgi:hypothetical protein